MSYDDFIVFYRDGFSRYSECGIPLLTGGFQFGAGCFEGIRGYWNGRDDQLNLLHLDAHFERLLASAKMLLLNLDLTVENLIDITLEVCRRNRFVEDVYVPPVAYNSFEGLGLRMSDAPTSAAIVATPFSP